MAPVGVICAQRGSFSIGIHSSANSDGTSCSPGAPATQAAFIEEVLELTQDLQTFFLCLGWEINTDCFDSQDRDAGSLRVSFWPSTSAESGCSPRVVSGQGEAPPETTQGGHGSTNHGPRESAVCAVGSTGGCPGLPLVDLSLDGRALVQKCYFYLKPPKQE